MKPLQNAINDNDQIRAIIRNTGINQDGKTSGITLPSAEAQGELIKSVYEDAGLNPLDTEYVEAHGTGTAAGDPIEAAAIAHSLARGRPSNEPLIVGSVKTNIGHTEALSGLAGLIKAALVVETGLIPPNLNYAFPNPNISLGEWNLKVFSSIPTFKNCHYQSLKH